MNDRTPIDKIETVRNSLASLLVLAFISTIPLFVFQTIPTDNKDIITYMVGQLSGMALMALGFYFTNKVGQDALDAKRTDNTNKALDAITTVATATGSTAEPEPDVTLKPGQTATVEAESESGPL